MGNSRLPQAPPVLPPFFSILCAQDSPAPSDNLIDLFLRESSDTFQESLGFHLFRFFENVSDLCLRVCCPIFPSLHLSLFNYFLFKFELMLCLILTFREGQASQLLDCGFSGLNNQLVQCSNH